MSNSDISKTCIKLRTLWESYNMTSHIKQKNAILIDLTNTARELYGKKIPYQNCDKGTNFTCKDIVNLIRKNDMDAEKYTPKVINDDGTKSCCSIM